MLPLVYIWKKSTSYSTLGCGAAAVLFDFRPTRFMFLFPLTEEVFPEVETGSVKG